MTDYIEIDGRKLRKISLKGRKNFKKAAELSDYVQKKFDGLAGLQNLDTIEQQIDATLKLYSLVAKDDNFWDKIFPSVIEISDENKQWFEEEADALVLFTEFIPLVIQNVIVEKSNRVSDSEIEQALKN